MVVKFPCGICQKAAGKKHNVACCDLCNEWIHIARNNLDKKNVQTFTRLQRQMVLYKLHKKISHADQELEKIYNGKHIISYKASEIESFTTKINNRISD